MIGSGLYCELLPFVFSVGNDYKSIIVTYYYYQMYKAPHIRDQPVRRRVQHIRAVINRNKYIIL